MKKTARAIGLLLTIAQGTAGANELFTIYPWESSHNSGNGLTKTCFYAIPSSSLEKSDPWPGALLEAELLEGRPVSLSTLRSVATDQKLPLLLGTGVAVGTAGVIWGLKTKVIPKDAALDWIKKALKTSPRQQDDLQNVAENIQKIVNSRAKAGTHVPGGVILSREEKMISFGRFEDLLRRAELPSQAQKEYRETFEALMEWRERISWDVALAQGGPGGRAVAEAKKALELLKKATTPPSLEAFDEHLRAVVKNQKMLQSVVSKLFFVAWGGLTAHTALGEMTAQGTLSSALQGQLKMITREEVGALQEVLSKAAAEEETLPEGSPWACPTGAQLSINAGA